MKTVYGDVVDLMQDVCKLTSKWAVYMSWYCDPDKDNDYNNWRENISPALDALNAGSDLSSDIEIYLDGFLICFVDTEEQMQRLFLSVVGDDGPTKYNGYDGYFRIYALTCSNEGVFWSENT